MRLTTKLIPAAVLPVVVPLEEFACGTPPAPMPATFKMLSNDLPAICAIGRPKIVEAAGLARLMVPS